MYFIVILLSKKYYPMYGYFNLTYFKSHNVSIDFKIVTGVIQNYLIFFIFIIQKYLLFTFNVVVSDQYDIIINQTNYFSFIINFLNNPFN
jgi:hypothetical protein